MLLFVCELELEIKQNCKMTKLIIDAARDKILFMITDTDINHNIIYENSKNNYEKLILLINEFLISKNWNFKKISQIYVNRGPGSFAGIRNSLSTVKAINLAKKIDYYCYSWDDFAHENQILHENIPNLCDKFSIKKNLINPIYIS